MLILVSGGNGSGKSRFAEKLASRFAGKKFYAATMIPYGPEGEARKQKHLRQREGLGFVTVECPYSLADVPAGAADLVLLEDVSNLLANAMFGPRREASHEGALAQIRSLVRRAGAVIAVTIGGLTGEGCDAGTQNYVAELNALNERLGDEAEAAIEMRGGRPHMIKGKCPWTV